MDAPIPGRVTVTTRPARRALETLTPGLAAEWSALADALAVDPFSRPEWVAAWSAMAGIPPTIATVRREGVLLGLYPVLGSGRRRHAAADWHTPHLDVVAAGAAREEVAAAVLAGAGHVVFDFATGATAAAARAALGTAGFRTRERVRQRSPWIDLGEGWDAYRERIPTRKWRELRRRRRRLDEEGVVNYQGHEGCDELDHLLSDGFAVEGSGWKDRAGTSIRSSAGVEEFYRTVARWAGARGMLRLHFLRLDGRPIAFDLALVASGAEWLLKTGFDPALAAFSPGAQLRAEVLERAFAAGLHRYEFLGGEAPWKAEWTDLTRPVVRIDGFAPGPAGFAADMAARVQRRWSLVRMRAR